MPTTQELIAKGRVYVLRVRPEYECYQEKYYTGKKPSDNIANAKKYDRKTAKGVQKHAHTGWYYNVVRVPSKMLFVMLLAGE